MYLVIPFTRVRTSRVRCWARRSASILWELGKNVFANSVGQSVRYSTIYGSLAVIPIFLIWLYITWIIVLLGLEIAFTHQHFAALVRSKAAGDRDECDRVPTGLQLFPLIAKRFHEGKDPPTADELSRRFLVATGSVDSHIERLGEGRARHDGWRSARAIEGVVPARSLAEVRVAEVIAAFIPMGDEEIRQRPIELEVEEIVSNFRDAGFEAVGETTFLELVSGSRTVETGLMPRPEIHWRRRTRSVTGEAGREYQHDFSEIHPKTMFDEMGRLQKARKTVAVILDALRQAGRRSPQTTAARHRLFDRHSDPALRRVLRQVVGIDIDDGAVEWARQNRAADNIDYRVGDSMELPFSTARVRSRHLHPHLRARARRATDVGRDLPRPAAGRTVLLCGRKPAPSVGRTLRSAFRDRAAEALGDWLRAGDGQGRGALRDPFHRVGAAGGWCGAFEITDYTGTVVRDPVRFEATDMVPPGSFNRKRRWRLLSAAYWAFPTYLWILRKPDGKR